MYILIRAPNQPEFIGQFIAACTMRNVGCVKAEFEIGIITYKVPSHTP